MVCNQIPLIAENIGYSLSSQSIINHLDLRIGNSGISVIMGPNGAGKSILLKILHGLITPNTGKITWKGKSIDTHLRDRQSLVLQKPVLLRRSAQANLQFVLKLKNKDSSLENIQFLLNQVALQDHANRPAKSLSGGEQQRLALARALSSEPEVLLLDEATASLDPASTHIIERIVMQQNQSGLKVIWVTHDLAQAKRLADSIIFMHKGQVVEHNSNKGFFNQPVSKQAQQYLNGELLV